MAEFRRYPLRVEQSKLDGWWFIFVDALPGLLVFGPNYEDLLSRLKLAAGNVFRARGETVTDIEITTIKSGEAAMALWVIPAGKTYGYPSRENRCYRCSIECRSVTIALITATAALSDALNRWCVLRLAIAVTFAEVGAIRLLTQSLEAEKKSPARRSKSVIDPCARVHAIPPI